MLAFLLGRIPKFWAFAALGDALPLSDRTVLIGAIAVTGVFLVVGLWRGRAEAAVETRDEGRETRGEGRETRDEVREPTLPRP
jgi:FtsZ-interacting cell division protein ZipA